MRPELVTVIIPSYNHAKYIGVAIEGLIAQTHENIELIILDDGSKDDSVSVIESYASRCQDRFSHYKFVAKANEGLARTLNMGIGIAEGEYILINGSDDVAEPELVSRLLPEISDHSDVALIACNNHIIDGDGHRCFWGRHHENVYAEEDAAFLTFMDSLQSGRKDIDLRSNDFGSYASLLRGNYIPNGYLQRKSALEAFGLYNPELPLEDWPTHMMLARENKVRYVDECLFGYRWHGDNNILDSKFGWPITRTVLLQEKEFAISNGYEAAWRNAYRLLLRERLHSWRQWLITINTSKRRRQLRLCGFYIVRPPTRRSSEK